jgi:vacuolar protein sorting-associated protein 18
MALNFDQFNNSQQYSSAREQQETQIVSSGYVQIKNDVESEIFQKKKMNINLPSNILNLTVANDWLVVLMSNQLLFRLNLKQPDKQSEVFLEKFITGLKVSKIFLDPTGNHLFLALIPKISGYNAELMYLNKSSNKPKIISKVNYFLIHELNIPIYFIFFSFAIMR